MLSSLSRILEGLDDEQQQAVVAEPGPVRILAGAGTGKTRTLTHRIAYHHHRGSAPAGSVLAVTHSTKAAGELRDRLALLGTSLVQARTFHSAAYWQLRHFWPDTGLPGSALKVATEGEVYSLMRRVLARVAGGRPADLDTNLVRDVRAEVSWAKARGHSPADYAAAADRAEHGVDGLGHDRVAAAYSAYESARRAATILDFDDLLLECAILLESDEGAAAAVQRRYQHLLVDEYQDTDPAQQRLLDAWLGERRSLCVVGDPRQTIYAFKGAEPSLLTDFPRRHPGTVTVNLVRDYRSGPQIVDIANRIMADTTANGGAREALLGLGPPGPTPTITRHDTEQQEAQALTRGVAQELADGADPGEIAVLVRFTAQTVALAAAFSDAGIRIATDQDYFARPEIVRALGALAAIAAAEPSLDANTALQRAVTDAGYDTAAASSGSGAVAERQASLASLLDLHTTLEELGHTTAAAALADLQRRRQEQHTPAGRNAVTLSTIHKAKGLEWDIVFLPRMTNGSLPSLYATSPEALDEERRLLYVAVTRARRLLHASHADLRDNGRRADPSPFLPLLRPAHATALRAPRSQQHPTSVRAAHHPRSDVGSVAWRIGQRVNHDAHGLGTVIGSVPGFLIVDFGEGPHRARRVKRDDKRLIPL